MVFRIIFLKFSVELIFFVVESTYFCSLLADLKHVKILVLTGAMLAHLGIMMTSVISTMSMKIS